MPEQLPPELSAAIPDLIEHHAEMVARALPALPLAARKTFDLKIVGPDPVALRADVEGVLPRSCSCTPAATRR